MTIDSFTSSFHKYLMHFYRHPAGTRHLAHGGVATLEKGENHCLRVAPCREPNDKLSLVAFERFTTLLINFMNTGKSTGSERNLIQAKHVLFPDGHQILLSGEYGLLRKRTRFQTKTEIRVADFGFLIRTATWHMQRITGKN